MKIDKLVAQQGSNFGCVAMKDNRHIRLTCVFLDDSLCFVAGFCKSNAIPQW